MLSSSFVPASEDVIWVPEKQFSFGASGTELSQAAQSGLQILENFSTEKKSAAN